MPIVDIRKKAPALADVPAEFAATYAEADRQKVARIIGWLQTGRDRVQGTPLARSQRSLVKLTGISQSTISQVLTGKYPAAPARKLDEMLGAIAHLDQARRKQHWMPFVQTSLYELVEKVCDRAREFADFGVLFALPGVGKTRSLTEYVSHHPDTLYVQAMSGMSRQVLLKRLIELTGATVRTQSRHAVGTLSDRKEAIIDTLSDGGRLIICDQANRLSDGGLEDLRNISDDANIGVVLAGTEKLEPMVQDVHGRFGELSSRIGFWPPLLKNIGENDCYLLVEACYVGGAELDPATLDAYWQFCGGSARELSKLIPTVQKYCKRIKAAPSAEIVAKCYRATMRPQRVRGR